MNPKVLDTIGEFSARCQEVSLTTSFDQDVAIINHLDAITIMTWYDTEDHESVYIADKALDRLEKVIQEIREHQRQKVSENENKS